MSIVIEVKRNKTSSEFELVFAGARSQDDPNLPQGKNSSAHSDLTINPYRCEAPRILSKRPHHQTLHFSIRANRVGKAGAKPSQVLPKIAWQEKESKPRATKRHRAYQDC
jgi:hypothetical protein